MGVAPGVYDTVCTLLSSASVTSLLKCYGKSSVAAWLHFKTWIRWKKLIPCHFKLRKITPSIQLNDLKWLRELPMQYIWDRGRPFIVRGFREPYEGALNCDMWPLLLEPPDSFPPLPLSPREGSTLFSPQYTPEPRGLIHALHSAFFIRWALFKTSAGGRGAPCRQRSESLNLMFWEHKLSLSLCLCTLPFLRLHCHPPCTQTSPAGTCLLIFSVYPQALPSPWRFPWFHQADVGAIPLMGTWYTLLSL